MGFQDLLEALFLRFFKKKWRFLVAEFPKSAYIENIPFLYTL